MMRLMSLIYGANVDLSCHGINLRLILTGNIQTLRSVFVEELENELVASCMAGYDGRRGWIYFLAVKSSQRRKRLASILVRHAEAKLVKPGCPKVELMVRKKNNKVISLYKSIGFDPDPIIVLSKRLIKDEKHDFG